MRIVALALILTTGCALDLLPGRDDHEHGGGSGGGALEWGECGAAYTATIFEPAAGLTSSNTVTTRVRWNEPDVPDRYMSMADHFGNYFISSGSSEILGDGSIVDHYTLPAGGSFHFEIGWFCDVNEPDGGSDDVLAEVDFSTPP